MPETSIPKPYFCQCKVDIDQSHHIMRRLRSHSPSLSLPSLRLSLSLTLSPGSVKRNRQPARGFRFAASSARLPAHSFRRAAFCVLLPVRCFRRAHGFLRAASVPRACVRACVCTGDSHRVQRRGEQPHLPPCAKPRGRTRSLARPRAVRTGRAHGFVVEPRTEKLLFHYYRRYDMIMTPVIIV